MLKRKKYEENSLLREISWLLMCHVCNVFKHIYLVVLATNLLGMLIVFYGKEPLLGPGRPSVFDQLQQCLCGKKKCPWEHVIAKITRS